MPIEERPFWARGIVRRKLGSIEGIMAQSVALSTALGQRKACIVILIGMSMVFIAQMAFMALVAYISIKYGWTLTRII